MNFNPVSSEGHFRGEDTVPDDIDEITKTYDQIDADRKAWLKSQGIQADDTDKGESNTETKAQEGTEPTSSQETSEGAPNSNPSEEPAPTNTDSDNSEQ